MLETVAVCLITQRLRFQIPPRYEDAGHTPGDDLPGFCCAGPGARLRRTGARLVLGPAAKMPVQGAHGPGCRLRDGLVRCLTSIGEAVVWWDCWAGWGSD
jgi:hypothetical protein